jgi:hypothetical protein
MLAVAMAMALVEKKKKRQHILAMPAVSVTIV